jgi:rod shape-determining protein MreD
VRALATRPPGRSPAQRGPLPRIPGAPPRGRPSRTVSSTVLAVVALAGIVVLLEVSVMPYLRVLDGIPDLVAPMVVGVAILRGTLAGALTGFGAGLAVELTAPVGTLGALALLYLAVGAYAGRYCERRESATLLAPLLLSVAGAGVVQVGYVAFHLLLDVDVSASELVTRILLPVLGLTLLLSPFVLLGVRRLLGEARILEPYAHPR